MRTQGTDVVTGSNAAAAGNGSAEDRAGGAARDAARGPAPRVVPLTREDADAVLDVDQWAFAMVSDDVSHDAALDELEWDRTYGAYVPDRGGEALAGVNSTFTLRLPVPGGEIDAGGLTWVGVHPQFRRRGVLTAMIRDHLLQVRDRGEPVSALHASEATIYGRFGYGTAGRHVMMELGRGAQLRDVPGSDQVSVRFERVDVERHADLVGDCFEAARAGIPGFVSRNTPGKRRRVLDDQLFSRRRTGVETLRILVAEADDGGPARGYALFRRKHDWSGASPNGTVLVRELVARDPAAAHALWSRLLDLDLMSTVELSDRPLDDPLLSMLADPRSAKPVVVDGIWVRLVDLPAALVARRYTTDVDVVLEVTDALCPWNAGRWHLTGGPGGAACHPADGATDAPVVSLDVRELGAAYLGSETLTHLASAGLVRASDADALVRTSAAFSWPVKAYTPWQF
jgi:predicted acetyltransferase